MLAGAMLMPMNARWPGPRPREILEARLFSLDDLPAGMPDAHRELAEALRA
jgi:hypothetical protein